MWKMERNTNNILDIHTHKAESVSAGKAIINRKLATDALCEGYFYSAGIHPWDLTEFDTERRLDRPRAPPAAPPPAPSAAPPSPKVLGCSEAASSNKKK